jgi:hypothetical protein
MSEVLPSGSGWRSLVNHGMKLADSEKIVEGNW